MAIDNFNFAFHTRIRFCGVLSYIFAVQKLCFWSPEKIVFKNLSCKKSRIQIQNTDKPKY